MKSNKLYGVQVFDNLVSPSLLARTAELMRKSGFSRMEKAYAKQDFKDMTLSCQLDLSIPEVSELGMAIVDRIVDHREFYCESVYAHCYSSMDAPEAHRYRDSQDGLVIMYFANDEWDWSYGGETVFFEDQEIKKAVLPKPGRFVIFDPADFHAQRPHNTRGPKFKYVIVWQLKRWIDAPPPENFSE